MLPDCRFGRLEDLAGSSFESDWSQETVDGVTLSAGVAALIKHVPSACVR